VRRSGRDGIVALIFPVVPSLYAEPSDRQLLFQSPFLLIVGLALLGGFVVLSKVYFFSAPLVSLSISLACYAVSIALSRALLMRS
jgi:hypothetical protein